MPPYRNPVNKLKDSLKIHLKYDRETTRCGLRIKTWMPYPAKNVTLDPDKITCGICRRSINSSTSKKGSKCKIKPVKNNGGGDGNGDGNNNGGREICVQQPI